MHEYLIKVISTLPGSVSNEELNILYDLIKADMVEKVESDE